MNKIAILPITTAMLFFAVGGVSAMWHGSHLTPAPELDVKNHATIHQTIVGSTNSGGNQQNDWASAYRIKYSGLDAGGGGRLMSTGDAMVFVDVMNRANVNLDLPYMSTDLRNKAYVGQNIAGDSNTGGNTQNSAAELKRSYKVGVSAGHGDRAMYTGVAVVEVGSINNLNVNHH